MGQMYGDTPEADLVSEAELYGIASETLTPDKRVCYLFATVSFTLSPVSSSVVRHKGQARFQAEARPG